MNRREALRATSLLLGTSIVGMEAFLTGCTPAKEKFQEFNDDTIAFLNEVAETIIPSTSSPGGKSANIGAFMRVIVTDCYSDKEQQRFFDGLRQINEKAGERFGQDFLVISPEQRTSVLEQIDSEARASDPKDAPHFFSMLNQLTVWGYFSSKEGVTQALRYVPIPGRYDGCIDYDGGSAWA